MTLIESFMHNTAPRDLQIAFAFPGRGLKKTVQNASFLWIVDIPPFRLEIRASACPASGRSNNIE